jgi:hypothetical protein
VDALDSDAAANEMAAPPIAEQPQLAVCNLQPYLLLELQGPSASSPGAAARAAGTRARSSSFEQQLHECGKKHSAIQQSTRPKRRSRSSYFSMSSAGVVHVQPALQPGLPAHRFEATGVAAVQAHRNGHVSSDELH